MSVSGDSSHRRVSSPWLMLPPSFSDGSMSYNFYSLAENRVFSLKKKSNLQSESPNDAAEIVGSSHGWLALYNRRDRSLFLSNPVTGEHIRLPPIETLDTFSGITDYEEKKCSFVKRVILSAPPHQQDCRATVTFSKIFRLSLAVCCPRRSSTWTEILNYEVHEDIVYSTRDRLFYILIEKEITSYDVEVCDCTDPSDPEPLYDSTIYFHRRGRDHDGRTFRGMKLLELYKTWPKRHLVYVEHTDQLLLVKRHSVEQMAPDGSPLEYPEYPDKTVVLDVYVIDRGTGGLHYMEDSLDGLVLFVGINHAFALRAADYPELKPDSIYFTEAKPFAWPVSCPNHKYGGDDIGIFDYKNKTISPCYYPCDHRSFNKIYPSPLWFTPSPH